MLPDLDHAEAVDEDIDYDDEADYDEFDGDDPPAQRSRAQLDDESLRIRGVLDEHRALGADVTPGNDQLHHYWTRDPEGRAKWVDSPKPWTTLVALLTRHVGLERAKTFASRWFHEVFGFYAGSDMNRVTHGKPPRGKLVGPG